MKTLTRAAVDHWTALEILDSAGPSHARGFLRAVAAACRSGEPVDVEALTPFPRRGLCFISFVVDWAESKFLDSWHDDEWEMLCEVRSQLEFFITLFGPTVAPDESAYLDAEEFDHHLRHMAEHCYAGGLPEDKIPPGTPRSHWWWWL